MYSLIRCVLLLSVIGVAFYNCGNSDDSPRGPLLDKRMEQLSRIDQYGAKPTFAAFTSACIQLQTDVDAFLNDATETRLTAAQNQWLTATKGYKRCELFYIGDVSRSFVGYQIHTWPVALEILEDTLSSNYPVTDTYMSGLGAHIVGLSAVEYLLFREGTLEILQNDAKQRAYLMICTERIREKAAELEQLWDTYSPEFTQATESRVSGGQNLMTNALLSYLNVTTKSKLGKALGETNGGLIEATRLEAPFSQTSLELLVAGFEEWKRCFYGDFPNSVDDYGFDDYLLDLSSNHRELVGRITAAVAECDAKIDALNNLHDDIADNTPKVVALSDAMKALAVLIEADLASVIGATITPNESDGD